jgi:hypothetical protein
VVRAWVDASGGLNVARGVALRITAALRSYVGRLRIQTGVDKRLLLEQERTYHGLGRESCDESCG